AAYSPHQVAVFMIRDVQETSICGHDVGADKVVRREAEAPRQMSESAANCESGDAGRGYDPTRHGQPEGLGLIVNVAPYAGGGDNWAGVGRGDANPSVVRTNQFPAPRRVWLCRRCCPPRRAPP